MNKYIMYNFIKNFKIIYILYYIDKLLKYNAVYKKYLIYETSYYKNNY